MLLVKTIIKQSDISGIGLFANEFIAKGTLVWRFTKGFDIRVNKNFPDTLSEPAKTFFMTYAYQNPTTLNYVLCTDNARYFNHSEKPNTDCVENPEDEDTANIATRDIYPGEELTVDYRIFDTNPYYGFEEKSKF